MKRLVFLCTVLAGLNISSVQALDLPSCGEETNGHICDKVYRQLNKLQKKGSPEASNMLAMLYMSGEYGLEHDPKKGIKLYEKAARQRSPVALYELAKMHFVGEHVKKDPEKAMEYMKRAAKRGYGDAKAMYNFMRLENAETQQEKDKYLREINSMAKKYDFDVDYFLGRYYLKEDRKDMAKAHLTAASEEGHVTARDMLASFFPASREEKPELFNEEFERILVTAERPDINATARDVLNAIKSLPQYNRKGTGTRIARNSCARDNTCHVVMNREFIQRMEVMFAQFRYHKVERLWVGNTN